MSNTNLTIVPNWQPPPPGQTPKGADVEVVRDDGGTWKASAALFDALPAPGAPVTSLAMADAHHGFSTPTWIDTPAPYLGVLAHATELDGTVHSKTIAFYECATGAEIGVADLTERRIGTRTHLVASS